MSAFKPGMPVKHVEYLFKATVVWVSLDGKEVLVNVPEWNGSHRHELLSNSRLVPLDPAPPAPALTGRFGRREEPDETAPLMPDAQCALCEQRGRCALVEDQALCVRCSARALIAIKGEEAVEHLLTTIAPPAPVQASEAQIPDAAPGQCRHCGHIEDEAMRKMVAETEALIDRLDKERTERLARPAPGEVLVSGECFRCGEWMSGAIHTCRTTRGEVVVRLPDVDVLEFITLCVSRRNTGGTDNEERWQKEALEWIERLSDLKAALGEG